LIIECSTPGSSTWNVPNSGWVRLGAIEGGVDIISKKYFILIPQSQISSHTRVRLRLQSRDHSATFGLPFDDNDSWAIDALQVYQSPSNETDFEVRNITLGNGYFTHVPREILPGIAPKVLLANRG